MRIHINEWVTSRIYVEHPECKKCRWLTEGKNKNGEDILYCIGSPEHKSLGPSQETIYFSKDEKPFLNMDRINNEEGFYELDIQDLCHDIFKDGRCQFVDIYDVTAHPTERYENEIIVKKWTNQKQENIA